MNALIPSQRYTSTDYLQAELEQLWPRVWQVAGLSSDLPAAGCYFTFEIGREAILVARSDQGVAAFHNVCMHRGRRLCEPGMGRTTSFQCPYHGWDWQTDGRLGGVPDRKAFAEGIPPAAQQLKKVACEEWAGWVWVSLRESPTPLRQYLGPVAPLIEAYRPQDYALVEDLTLDLPCNWKVCIDAFNEVYHLKSVHPEILGMVDDVNVRTDRLGQHGRLVVPFTPSPHVKNRAEVDGALRWMLEEAGIPESEMEGSALDMRVRVQQSVRQRERDGDFDCSQLSDEQLTDSNHFHIFPNFQIDLYSLKMMSLRARPHPTDPGRMLLDQQRFERTVRGAERPPRPAHVLSAYGDGSLGTVTDQDMYNLVRVQQGMSSSGFPGLVVGDHELLIRHLHDTLDEYVRS